MLCRCSSQHLPRAAAQVQLPLRAPSLQSRARLYSSFPTSTKTNRPGGPRSRAVIAGWLFAAAAIGVSGLLSLRLVPGFGPIHAQSEKSRSSRSSRSSSSSSSNSHVPTISHLDAQVIEDAGKPMRIRMETYVKLLQHRIVTALSKEETKASFFIDTWQRKEGGEGISCVLQDGDTFEKAGVNISIVHGQLPPRAIAQMSADHHGLVEKIGYKLGLKDGEEKEVSGLPFYASGLSLVVHPKNPFAPTVHFNYRYFELTHPKTLLDGSPNPKYDENNPTKPAAWWFGGGSDLTPIYLFSSDSTHFHNTLKEAADANDVNFYPNWKKWCDIYFWIPHRAEARGVGGIFFDDLTVQQQSTFGGGNGHVISLFDGTKRDQLHSNLPHTQESLFRTVRSLGDAFLPAYLPIVQSRKGTKYNQDHIDWQAIRRGRYVEFNLVYDRGTKFGLQTPGARIESILMSLPLRASWQYGHKYSGMGKPDEGVALEDGLEERKMMEVLREPRDWASV